MPDTSGRTRQVCCELSGLLRADAFGDVRRAVKGTDFRWVSYRTMKVVGSRFPP